MVMRQEERKQLVMEPREWDVPESAVVPRQVQVPVSRLVKQVPPRSISYFFEIECRKGLWGGGCLRRG